MKIRRIAVAFIAAAALALTGCSSTDSSEKDDAAKGGSEAGGAFPATVETAFGPVEIEKKPERIVALGWGDAEVALALGSQPVGAADWIGFGGEGVGPWAEGLYDEAPEILGTLELSYEAIAALKPDLILDVRSSGDKDRYERLSQITTTVGIPQGAEQYLTKMEQQVSSIATALGVPEKGEELLADVDKAYADTAAAYPDFKGKTVTAAAKTSEGWGAYVEGDSRVATLTKLGFEQNPTIAALKPDASGFSTPISSEELDKLEADLIVAFPIFLEATAITDDPQWKKLKAVSEERAVVIDGDISNAFSAATPAAEIYALEKLAPLFDKALGGK